MIDDDLAVCDTLAGHLSRAGIECSTVNDGETGLDLLSRERFHAVVLDHRLPGMLGLTALKRLRSRGDSTPVLVLTGYADYRCAHEVGTYANTGYDAKPIGAKAFLQAVQRLLADRTGTADTPMPCGDRHQADSLPQVCLTKSLRPGVADRRQVSAVLESAPQDELLTALTRVIGDPASSLFVVVAACRSFRHLRTSPRTFAEGPRRTVRDWLLDAAELRWEELEPWLRPLRDIVSLGGWTAVLQTTSALATQLSVSDQRLRLAMHREFGISPARLRLILRLRPVIRALVETDEQVAQIAYASGYGHASHLDHDIRRLLDVSPRELRKRSTSSDGVGTGE